MWKALAITKTDLGLCSSKVSEDHSIKLY